MQLHKLLLGKKKCLVKIMIEGQMLSYFFYLNCGAETKEHKINVTQYKCYET